MEMNEGTVHSRRLLRVGSSRKRFLTRYSYCVREGLSEVFRQGTFLLGLLFLSFVFVSGAQAQQVGPDEAATHDRSDGSTAQREQVLSSHPALRKIVSVRFEEVTLEYALRWVAKKAKLKLSYSRDLVSIDQPVSLVLKDVQLLEVLNEITKSERLKYIISRSGHLVVTRQSKHIKNIGFDDTLPEGISITGKVIDAETGNALSGVVVLLDGTKNGTVTDDSGSYQIENVPPGVYRVKARFIGYRSEIKTITIRDEGYRTSDAALSTATRYGIFQNVEEKEYERSISILGSAWRNHGENVSRIHERTSDQVRLDFELREEPLDMEEITIEFSIPVIRREVAGLQRLLGIDEIQAGSYRDINDLVIVQPGITSVSAYEDQPTIRGSRMEESIFIVDGIKQEDPLNHRPFYRTSLDAIEYVRVETGGFDAEHGNVRSGIINVVTRSGGEELSGSINIQYSPPALKHFGPMIYGFDSPIVRPFVDPDMGAFSGIGLDGQNNPFFEGWEKVAKDAGKAGPHVGKPQELYARWLWRHRSREAIAELKRLEKQGVVRFAPGVDPEQEVLHEYGVRPDYRIGLTLGGSVPVLENARFFASYTKNQSEYAFLTAEPVYSDHQFRLKLEGRSSRNTSFLLHAFVSRQRGSGGGEGPGLDGMIRSNPFSITGAPNKMWYPDCARPGVQDRIILAGRLVHLFTPTIFGELQLTHSRTDYKLLKQNRNTAPVPGDGPGQQTNLNDGLIGTAEEADARAAAGEPGWENWRDWARIRIGNVWYDEAPRGHVPVNWRDVTGYYRLGSCKTRINDSYSRLFELSGSITGQVTRRNQIKGGVQIRRDRLHEFYTWYGASTNQGTVEAADAAPWSGAVYLQDRLEMGDFIASIGIRADWILHSPYPVADNSGDAYDLGPYTDLFLSSEGKPVYDRIGQIRFSPRIGFSFPITKIAKVFLNYGHFYQWPEMDYAYRIVRQLSAGGRIDHIGNPLLEPPRTIAYEAGFKQNLFDRISLTLSGYYKDINNELAPAEFFPLSFGGESYSKMINRVYRDVRGLEAFLELRRGSIPFVSGWASLNYVVESSGYFGVDQFYEDPGQQPIEYTSEVTNNDARPILKLNLDFRSPERSGPAWGGTFYPLGGVGVSLLYTWQRGERFTWNPDGIPYVEGNVRWRPYRRWDLRFSKALFSTQNFSSDLYIDVINLFNQRNMTPRHVNWAWDGHRWWKNEFVRYMESLDLEVQRDGTVEGEDRPGDWDGAHIHLPGFTPWTFLEHRDVFFGVRVTF